jgi:hypothetical protein
VTTCLVLAGITAFVIAQLHPGLLFLNTEDVGGDNAAHITAPYYMIHYLLPHGQISGWDSWWFDGFPLYVFYFPLPALFVAFFNLFAPYAVAFKLVTVLGTVTLPICCWAFGCLAGLRRPIPVLLAAGSLTYLFNTSYTIDGGNIASTMAGEFSFSLSLSFTMLFLGVFVYALRTGRLRWLAAILYLLSLLSHVVPAIFAAGAATLFALAYNGSRSLVRVLLPVGLAGGMLSAFWLLPFDEYVHLYSSSMNYGPVGGSLWSNIFPHTGELAVAGVALIGFVIAVWHAQRVMLAIGIAAIASAAMFQWGPAGLIYNGRWLPFWFLMITLLAAYAVAELARMVFAALRLESWHDIFTPLFGGLVSVVLMAAWLAVMPFGIDWPLAKINFSDNWIVFNYRGYQLKPGWGEFSSIVQMLDAVGKKYGCGRLDYEYTPNNSNYMGSTLVEMSFPLWTNGCIDSTEGVYFESSTTTHFHFLDQSELSIDASNPVGGLMIGTQSAYENTNVADGVKHLQLQGVNYFLANSPEIEQQADADPSLVQLAAVKANPQYVDYNPSTGKQPPAAEWVVYKIKDSPLVTPLHDDPVVENGLDVTSVANLDTPQGIALLWYQQKQYWSVPIAASGPPAWIRWPLGYLASPAHSRPVVPTTVSDIRHDKSYSWISFDVGRLGSPVEVKIPYFPNWHATGAEGPYLVTPNLMVVIPTSHHVRLSYGTTSIDTIGKAATVAGIAAVLGLNIRRSPPPESFVESEFDVPAPRDPEDDLGDIPDDPYTPIGWSGPLPMLPRPDPDPGAAGPYADDPGGPDPDASDDPDAGGTDASEHGTDAPYAGGNRGAGGPDVFASPTDTVAHDGSATAGSDTRLESSAAGVANSAPGRNRTGRAEPAGDSSPAQPPGPARRPPPSTRGSGSARTPRGGQSGGSGRGAGGRRAAPEA